MSVLVDTSVWIQFLANRPPYGEELDRLLESGQILGHELIYGELLIGDKGGRRVFLASYEMVRRVATVPHMEVVDFVRLHKLFGRGVSWIDVHLLAAAIVYGCRLWTADARLSMLAREFGVDYPFSPARTPRA